MTNYTEKYEKKIEEMRKDLQKKEYASYILDKLNENLKWDALNYVKDEESEEGYHFEEPTEESYDYYKFLAYKEALEVLEKHFFGK